MGNFDEIIKIIKQLTDLIWRGGSYGDINYRRLLGERDRAYIQRNLTNEKLKQDRASKINEINIHASEDWRKLQKRTIVVMRYYRLKVFLRVAAAIVIIIGAGYLYRNIFMDGSNQLGFDKRGKNISLRLNDGSLKIITVDKEQVIKSKTGQIVAMRKGNLLYYYGDTKAESTGYNELKTPYGKIFQVELSDGTRIHLNAGASLKHPGVFAEGKERRVFLKGEAYFDVAEDTARPFVVMVDGLSIRVTGTQFNLSCYPEDDQVSAVLVAGSISLFKRNVKSDKNTAILLKPGYKALWSKSQDSISVEKTNTHDFTSWIEGKLVFNHMPFKKILKKLERQYNVVIKNNNKQLDKQLFTASFDEETIEEVLISFSKNCSFDFSIQGDSICVN